MLITWLINSKHVFDNEPVSLKIQGKKLGAKILNPSFPLGFFLVRTVNFANFVFFSNRPVERISKLFQKENFSRAEPFLTMA